MRNPGRVTAALRTAMQVFPDQRVAQLIYNAVRKHKPGGSVIDINGPMIDIFNIEDDALAECLERYYQGA
jgi:hypothetical protein